jgi:hypothetical protein
MNSGYGRILHEQKSWLRRTVIGGYIVEYSGVERGLWDWFTKGRWHMECEDWRVNSKSRV